MELLQEVANIAGKPGLYKIIKPGRVGVIVESIDALRKREMVSSNAKVSVLKEISIYTEDVNKAIPLGEVFAEMKKKFDKGIEFDYKNATKEGLFDFFAGILPDFDKEKVYPTDIKKMIQWYQILNENFVEVFETKKIEPVKEDKPKADKPKSAEKAPKKTESKAKVAKK